jgi:hypothetical protein
MIEHLCYLCSQLNRSARDNCTRRRKNHAHYDPGGELVIPMSLGRIRRLPVGHFLHQIVKSQ